MDDCLESSGLICHMSSLTRRFEMNSFLEGRMRRMVSLPLTLKFLLCAWHFSSLTHPNSNPQSRIYSLIGFFSLLAVNTS